ncbi:cytochrome P450, partial [Streptomyces sp. NPDC002784]
LYGFPITARRALRDVVVGGYRIRAGTETVLNTYGLHRDPAVFPQPHVFSPDRWLNRSVVSPNSFLPFGAGAHYCLGASFVSANAAVALATLVSRWRLRTVPGKRPALAPLSLFVRPDQLIMTATPHPGRPPAVPRQTGQGMSGNCPVTPRNFL